MADSRPDLPSIIRRYYESGMVDHPNLELEDRIRASQLRPEQVLGIARDVIRGVSPQVGPRPPPHA